MTCELHSTLPAEILSVQPKQIQSLGLCFIISPNSAGMRERVRVRVRREREGGDSYSRALNKSIVFYTYMGAESHTVWTTSLPRYNRKHVAIKANSVVLYKFGQHGICLVAVCVTDLNGSP
jgi:hypothetical protein